MLQQNTVNKFIAENVPSGEIHLLVSGGLGGLAVWNNQTGLWTWPNSGSWERNQVDDNGNWTEPVETVVGNLGTLQEQVFLKGLAVSIAPKDSSTRKLEALKLCTRIKMNIQIGTSPSVSLDLQVRSRKVQGSYVFFEVDEELLPVGSSSDVNVYFKYREDEYRGYTCYTIGNQETTISLYPYVPPIESEEYNPVLNNILQDTVSTLAQVVEPFEYKNVFLGTVETNADHWYNGWYANWNSSEDYNQRLNGSGALWVPGEDPVVRVNAGGALGIYQLLPTVFLEKGTQMANIPDYYFTSLANTSGRWLGSKNAEYRIYLGNKREFTFKNLELCNEFIKTNVQRGNLLVYQGSPFVVDTVNQEPVIANISGSIKGTVLSGKFSGSIDRGFLEGTVSGEVTNIDLNHRVSYYSSSVPLQDYTTYTPGQVSIQGEGTRFLDNSGRKVQTLTEGMQRLEGEYRFAGTVANNQILKIAIDRGSGTILSWGGIVGSGTVDVFEEQETGSRSNTFFKDIQLSGSGLQISNVQTGSMYIIPSGTVDVSGTVGTVAESMSLHIFNGCIQTVNNSIQKVGFTSTDDLGVILTNIETAEQSETSFDSLVADSITFGDGFGGQAGLSLSNGRLNVASNGPLKVSLLTEDQEIIPGTGSFATGSLHGTELFMSATLDGDPVWDFNEIRTQLDPGEFLPNGIALLSGSFGNFTLQGTRANLRVFPYLRRTGSVILQYDTLQASRLLSNLRTGVDFAKLALARSGSVEISELNPKSISDVQLPSKVYEAVDLASTYVVSGAVRIENGVEVPDLDPIWVDTGSILPSDFNFYETGSLSRNKILNFISGSERAITRLSGFMSGSSPNIPFLRRPGQYTYVYLCSSIPKYLKVGLQDFSGSFVRTTGEVGSQSTGFLSGSFKQLWGRFGEGVIEQGRLFETNQVSVPTANVVSLDHEIRSSDIFGVIYGAFDYKGYLAGGYEGNMVEGTVEGTLSGLVSGITSGNIKGSLVNIVGTSRGTFEGTVEAGTFVGAMKDVSIEGNNLANNVFLSGSISGVENFPLQGTVLGPITSVTLPDQCNYYIDGFSVKSKQTEAYFSPQGEFTGELKVYPERVGEIEVIPLDQTIPAGIGEIVLVLTHSLDTQELVARIYSGSQEIPGITVGTPNDFTVELTIPVYNPISSYQMTGTIELQRGFDWTGVLGTKTEVNLIGESIGDEVTINGTVSSSLKFGPNGELSVPPVVIVDNQVAYSENSQMSGQFEVSGSVQIQTGTGNPFSGKISPIFVSQSVQGEFNAHIEDRSYLDISGQGKIQEMTGHILLQGEVELTSGAQGNLVEGHDRPFFTLQTFSGSIFPMDTSWEAFQNMSTVNTVNTTVTSLTFTSGMALLNYSSGSFGVVKEQEYVKNTLTLPQIGDIIFTGEGGKARVVSSKIYCPDLHGVLTVNDKGTVIAIKRMS